jgi:DNA-directed RNA polymerase specialized sigma24 family protein
MRHARAADLEVQALSLRFDLSLKESQGSKVYFAVRRRLCAHGVFANERAWEAFQTGIEDAYAFLHEHGHAGIRAPSSWLFAVCRNAAVHYLQENVFARREPLSDALAGKSPLLSTLDERTLEWVRGIILGLAPSHRRFILLDLLECRSPAEICEALEIPSAAAFRARKSRAFAALRKALLEGKLGDEP